MVTRNAGRVDRAAQQRPGDLADRDVARSERRREHAVVGVRVLVLDEEVERGVEQRAVHRRGREQAGRDERLVVDDVTSPTWSSPTSSPTPMPIDKQEEDRLERTRRGRRTRCAGTRGCCARRAATNAARARREQPGTRRGTQRTGSSTRSWPQPLRERAHAPHRARGDAGDEERDVPRGRARSRTGRWSRRARARRRATTARARASGCRRVGQLADREERPREQEQRQDAEAHDQRERDVGLLADRERGKRRRRTRRRTARPPGSRGRPTPTGRRRAARRRAGTRSRRAGRAIAVQSTKPP